MKRLACLLILALGCGSDEETVPAPFAGTLTVELRDRADVALELLEGDALRVTLTASAGYGLVPTGTAMIGNGWVEHFPETDGTLYTARFDGPAQDGLCGDEPVSLALSLHRQGGNATVIGGIACYCGSGVWHGRPVRILRLDGAIPLPPPAE
jgi:hypothetical protein